MQKRVVSLSDVENETISEGKKFAAQRKRLTPPFGMGQLGCSWYSVPFGKQAFPYHYHSANEEALFILSGTGTLRTPEGTRPVKQGDYIALPVGPAHAHALINTDEAMQDLVYLCISTKHPAEICGYPDSGKIAAFSWTHEAERANERNPYHIRNISWANASLGYYDGEEADSEPRLS